MGQDEALHDREPESRAAPIRVRLLVALEDRCLEVGGDADPGVRHLHHDVLVGDLRGEPDDPRRLAVLHGVREQVHEHLVDPLGVEEQLGDRVGYRDLQAESAVLRPGADLVHRALDHGVDVGGIEIELKLAGPELAEIEDLRDQAQEPGRVHPDVLDE